MREGGEIDRLVFLTCLQNLSTLSCPVGVGGVSGSDCVIVHNVFTCGRQYWKPNKFSHPVPPPLPRPAPNKQLPHKTLNSQVLLQRCGEHAAHAPTEDFGRPMCSRHLHLTRACFAICSADSRHANCIASDAQSPSIDFAATRQESIWTNLALKPDLHGRSLSRI